MHARTVVARRTLPMLQRRMFSPTTSCCNDEALELMEGISFNQPEEYKMVKELAASFVDDFLIPLEPALLEREANGERHERPTSQPELGWRCGGTANVIGCSVPIF